MRTNEPEPEKHDSPVGAFDALAPAYDGSIPPHLRRHLLGWRAAVVASVLPGGRGRVLDVGCGHGHLVHRLRGMGMEADGLDLSPAMIAEARKGPGAFIVGDIAGNPPPSGGYDLAVSFGVLHYLVAPTRVEAALANMVNAVRPGGLVLVSDNNPLNPYWRRIMRHYPMDGLPTRLVTEPEIRRGFDKSGGRIVRTWRTGWVPDFVPPALLPGAVLVSRMLDAIPGVASFGAYLMVLARRP